VDFNITGYATLSGGTTGGQGGPTITVNTGTALQDAIQLGGPRIIYVNGTINPGNSSGLSKIDIKDVSNISILGTGTSGELNGIGIKIWRASNVIIRNLRIHHVDIGDKDCIGIEGPSDHIWVDHCELYNDLDHDKDYYDGLLDAKGESEYITYSWNYLHDSYKTCLVGSSDDDNYDRKITFHHSRYDNCFSRLPLYRFGTGHIYNCYYTHIIDTGINSRMGAVLRVENTWFENSRDPLGFWYSDLTGYWDVSNNRYVNCTGSQPTSSTGSFNPPYSYSLDAVDSVPATVQQYSGVGKI
jgi:pectate lyase